MPPTRRPRARWVQVVGWAALVALITFGAGFALLFFTMGVAGNIDSDDGVAGRILDNILLLLLWLPAVAFAATLVILGIRDLVAMGIRRWR